MGLGSFAAGMAVDAAAKKAEMQRLMRGRTPEQKKVIKYFYGAGGCLSKFGDEEYDAMLKERLSRTNFKQMALNKLGVDESQVNEIEPVHFEGFSYDGNNTFALQGKDGKWRSSAYEITWIFFSSEQVYAYKYIFNMDTGNKKELTDEYFYKDVTNFSSASDTVEKEVAKTSGCLGKVSYIRTDVNTERFRIVVPGESFACSIAQSSYSDSAIKGMKAKLREKKNS